MNEETEETTDKVMRKVSPLQTGITAFLIILLFAFLFGFKIVRAGEVKVVTRFGKATGRVLEPGANFIIPIAEGVVGYNVKKITYETSEEEKHKGTNADYVDYPVGTTTRDGQGVDLTYTIRFRIDATKAVWLLNNIGSEAMVVEKVVKTDSRAWTRTVTRDFEAKDLYSGNIRETQEKIADTLRPLFAANGLILDEFVLREPGFDEKYQAVMESKQRELEQVKVEEYLADQETFKKQARITAAEGKAQEQALQRETLSPQVLEKIGLEVQLVMAEALRISAEKGQKIIPDVVLGEGQNLFYQLPQGSE